MLRKSRWHRYIQVLYVLGWLAKQNGKNYCYPSQDKICELLQKRYNIKYSRRHLNRILNLLEENGFFKRMRRHKKGNNGGIQFNSTLYLLTSKCFKILGKTGFFLKSFVQKMTKKLKEATEAGKKEFDPFSLPPDQYIEFLKNLYRRKREASTA